MANQGPLYGIAATIKQKREETYEVALEQALQKWIEGVLGITFPSSFQESLKDGIILCNLANTLRKGVVRRIDTGSNLKPFKMMENINAFLKACVFLGLSQNDCFVTVDLYEGKNMNAVLDTLQLLAKHSKSFPGYKGPNFDDLYRPAVSPYQEEISKAQGLQPSESASRARSSSNSANRARSPSNSSTDASNTSSDSISSIRNTSSANLNTANTSSANLNTANTSSTSLNNAASSQPSVITGPSVRGFIEPEPDYFSVAVDFED
eukprot:TRINITY_DN185_c0_g1_i2.p1 TRINITY_DN185_c0_g1~~TRINITY_DN185_c0_g1_i2.p1  ORF type:complete len:276 (-),score=49.87 TRINITY_DN185_c0_g1_i2:24-818(-)